MEIDHLQSKIIAGLAWAAETRQNNSNSSYLQGKERFWCNLPREGRFCTAVKAVQGGNGCNSSASQAGGDLGQCVCGLRLSSQFILEI